MMRVYQIPRNIFPWDRKFQFLKIKKSYKYNKIKEEYNNNKLLIHINKINNKINNKERTKFHPKHPLPRVDSIL